MGSLMAGWDAPFKDPNIVKYQRNKSLTREEIDAFWQSMRQNDQINQVSYHGNENQENINPQVGGGRFQRSYTLPLTDRSENTPNFNLEKCWWTRSSSAFLNETPVEAMDSPTYKYASQYHLSSFSPFSRKLEASST